MKYWVFLSFLISSPLFANNLLGAWSYCEIEKGELFSIEHVFEFDENNVVFEHIVMYEKSHFPCQGKVEIATGNYWHYQIQDNKLNFTKISTFIIPGIDFWVKEFNKTKMCGHENWKNLKRFECESDKSGLISAGRGHKKVYEYEVVGEELRATRNNNTTIYKKIR
jgi:hypothetical protein